MTKKIEPCRADLQKKNSTKIQKKKNGLPEAAPGAQNLAVPCGTWKRKNRRKNMGDRFFEQFRTARRETSSILDPPFKNCEPSGRPNRHPFVDYKSSIVELQQQQFLFYINISHGTLLGDSQRGILRGCAAGFPVVAPAAHLPRLSWFVRISRCRPRRPLA